MPVDHSAFVSGLPTLLKTTNIRKLFDTSLITILFIFLLQLPKEDTNNNLKK